jgi:hypothetical protein
VFQQRDVDPKRPVEVHTFPSSDEAFRGTVDALVGNKKMTPIALEERIHDNYPAARVVVQDQLGRAADPSGTLPVVWYAFRDNAPRPREGRVQPQLHASAAPARSNHGAGGPTMVGGGQALSGAGLAMSRLAINGKRTRLAGWTPLAPIACQFCGAPWPTEGLGVVGRPRDRHRTRSVSAP